MCWYSHEESNLIPYTLVWPPGRVCVCVHVLVVVVVIQLLSGAHRLKGLPFVIWNLIGSCCSISTLQVCAEAMVCLECVLDGAASV